MFAWETILSMLFGSKHSDYYVGIDFGTRSIKAVELRMKKNTPELVNYGWVMLDHVKEALDETHADYSQILHHALTLLLKQMDLHTKKVGVAIPAFNGLVMMIDFPLMNDEELAQAIQYEARKYIPISLDDVNISWDRTSVDEKAKKMKVILVAAPKSEVQYYDNLFEGTHVTVDALELETFALTRALVGTDKGRHILLDIGAKTTNLVFVDNGMVHINRNIDVGGVDVTSSIADAMKIAPDKAREMKEGERNFFSGPTAIHFPAMDYIFAEVDRVMSAQNNPEIDAVIISGGTAHMTGLAEYMTQIMKKNVIIGNPFSRLIVDPKVSDFVGDSVSSTLSVAIGLALRNISDR